MAEELVDVGASEEVGVTGGEETGGEAGGEVVRGGGLEGRW